MRTTSINGLKVHTPKNLLDNLPSGNPSQVWNVLAELGRQLENLARAQNGQGNFRAPISPPAYAPDSLTVVELVNLFLLTKSRAGKSERYLIALRYSLGKFTLGRAHKPIHEITVSEIEDWMHALNLAPRTQHGYIGDVRTLFNFAMRRGLIKTNPANGVELPALELDAVAIHTPDQVKTVLQFARQYDLSICRALAIRYFAGLRTCEVQRVNESCLTDDYLEVSAAHAKGARARRRRLVKLQPNLRAWLALGGELPAPNSNGRRMLEFMRALTAQGIAWPHNVTRHSFVSYHLAKFQNAGKTALEAGHTEQMLFAHYRELVKPETAEIYFNIFPSSPATH